MTPKGDNISAYCFFALFERGWEVMGGEKKKRRRKEGGDLELMYLFLLM